MSPSTREVVIWVGGALCIVVAVLAWLYFSQPEENLLPEQYRFGVL